MVFITSQLTPTLTWSEEVTQTYGRIFLIREDTLNGTSSTLDTQKIKIKHKFMSNGHNQRTHSTTQMPDITLHPNSTSSLEEIITSQDSMEISHKLNSTLEKVPSLETKTLDSLRIHSDSKLELILITKMHPNLNQKSNQTPKYLIVQQAPKIQLPIENSRMKKNYLHMVMDFG